MTYAAPNALRNPGTIQEQRLQPATRTWIAQLPSCLELQALTEHYPRIANRLASLWSKPAQCEHYIDELLFNDRPGIRRGFPPRVCREIMQLKYALAEAYDERKRHCTPAFA